MRRGKTRALQGSEEAQPPMSAEEFQRVAHRPKASTGVGAGGFHPKLPFDCGSDTCRRSFDGENR